MKKVNICTISMDYRLRGSEVWTKATAFTEAEKKILSALTDKPDLFLLPEVFLTGFSADTLKNPDTYEQEGNSIYLQFANLARKCNAYIAVPMLTENSEGRHNSTVLFDRQGEVVYTYHKAHPTKEELKVGILPGTEYPEVYDTDFGRIGLAICWDLQFQPLFKHYHNKGIELLLFSSYFPGGFILRSLAFQYSFFIVSSHAQGNESVFVDNYGRKTAMAGMFSMALTQTINLDSAVLPIESNIDKISLIKTKYGSNAVEAEIHRPEGRLILKSVCNKITIKQLIKEFKLTTLAECFHHKNLC